MPFSRSSPSPLPASLVYPWVQGKLQGKTVSRPNPKCCGKCFHRLALTQAQQFSIDMTKHEHHTRLTSKNKHFSTGWTSQECITALPHHPHQQKSIQRTSQAGTRTELLFPCLELCVQSASSQIGKFAFATVIHTCNHNVFGAMAATHARKSTMTMTMNWSRMASSLKLYSQKPQVSAERLTAAE